MVKNQNDDHWDKGKKLKLLDLSVSITELLLLVKLFVFVETIENEHRNITWAICVFEFSRSGASEDVLSTFKSEVVKKKN